MKFIFLFTTGRSGTGFLSQVFGSGEYSKNKIHEVASNRALVTHESWKGFPITNIKSQLELDSDPAINMVNDYLNDKISEVKRDYPKAERYFVTDHRIGKFCIPSLYRLNIDFKVIRLTRDHKKVSSSFFKRVKDTEKKYDKVKFEKYYRQVWDLNMYHPMDPYVIKKVDQKVWSKTSMENKFLWYSEEVERQWEIIKQKLDNDQYIEVDFTEIIKPEGLNKVKDFVKIPWSEAWAEVPANK